MTLSNRAWVIFIFAIFFAILVVAGLLFKFYKTGKKNTNGINELLAMQKDNSIKKIEIILQRIKSISLYNKEYIDIYERLDKQYDIIFSRSQKVSKEIQSLQINCKKMKRSKFIIEFSKVEEMVKTISQSIAKFQSNAKGITQQETLLKSELSYYREILRDIMSHYATRRILLDKISPIIENENTEIKLIAHDFENTIKFGDIEKALKLISRYRKKIIEVATLINEAPIIQIRIFDTVPKAISKLYEIFEKSKRELKTDLNYMDFSKNIKSIEEQFKDTKNAFLTGNIVDSKKKVKLILKSIKMLEKMINHEIKARNIFLENFINILKETKKTLSRYVSIKAQLKEIIIKNNDFPKDILELKDKIVHSANILDEYAISFESIVNEKKIPYTSKVNRMKIIINYNLELTGIMNNIISILWRSDIEKVESKNKYRRLESAINELRGNITIFKLVLTPKESESIKEIEKIRIELQKFVSAKDYKSTLVNEKIELLSSLVSDFYKVIGGKLQMSLISQKLIKEFAPQRAENNQLNHSLSLAERKFLEGEYATSLNVIITALEGTHVR